MCSVADDGLMAKFQSSSGQSSLIWGESALCFAKLISSIRRSHAWAISSVISLDPLPRHPGGCPEHGWNHLAGAPTQCRAPTPARFHPNSANQNFRRLRYCQLTARRRVRPFPRSCNRDRRTVISMARKLPLAAATLAI